MRLRQSCRPASVLASTPRASRPSFSRPWAFPSAPPQHALDLTQDRQILARGDDQDVHSARLQRDVAVGRTRAAVRAGIETQSDVAEGLAHRSANRGAVLADPAGED